MTFFQFKSFSFINHAIKRIVEYIKANAKKQCLFVNLKNPTFWKNIPRGDKIVIFFKEMNENQIIKFFGFFDIFFVGYQNGIYAFISMTADPSSLTFKKTLWVSISKGYNLLRERFSGRETPSIECDLRSSIGSTPVQTAEFSTSPDFGFESSKVESAFHQGLSTFGAGAGPATQPVSPFQEFASGFSRFSTQPLSFGASTNPFTSQADFVPIQPMDEPINREGIKLAIRKGRICRVEIPSGCSSGPSTSSTVGIAKSPKAKTPVSTTIANLVKKISRLEMENLAEGSPDYLTLVVSKAKLKKIQNSL
jgi:hypothetical protein